jgi:hypothetical protein
MGVTMSEKNRKAANRLINQTSPYLLQHAYNPVDWYPWGSEAFEKAAKENKPIFLSIGYATCHWCHVMEAESFENEHIAGILNTHFVAIKVDREERPDLDDVYMAAVQLMTGAGGWPLSAFLTPQRRPFYGGTYFPPQDVYGRPGFERVLLSIADAWKNRRDEVINSAENVTNILTPASAQEGFEQLKPPLLEEAFVQINNAFDPEYGGIGSSPKFPSPSYLYFLMCYWLRVKEDKALQMVTKTLDCMAAGGIYDHIGGGFHRYSTDRRWRVPHFEKMLYDQALISRCYVQAWQITKNPEYAHIAAETFDYVLRDMRDASGGFYSAEDADSEGREGTFYLWSPEEIEAVLGVDEGGIFNEYYGVTEEGNFEDKNILSRTISIEDLAANSDCGIEHINEILFKSRKKLLVRRDARIRPSRDEKIIAGWNGLMIESLAYGGVAMQKQKYIDAAAASAEFIFGTLLQKGRLMRYCRDGKVVEKAYLDDYAAMAAAMIALYEATFNAKWLRHAIELTDTMIELFEDTQQGGFFLNGSDSEKLIILPKPSHDGAIPCGNSTAAEALLKLGRLTMNTVYTEKAAKTLKAFSKHMSDSPLSLTQMMIPLGFWLGPTQEIVIAAGANAAQAKEMLQLAQRYFLPNAVIIFHDSKEIEKIVPFVKSQTAVDNKATAYVCENYVCKKPITELTELEKTISVPPTSMHCQ